MRNLKKVLAVILTVAMLASFMVPAFAAVSYLEEAKKLQAIGLFAGGEADLKLDEDVTRIQGLTFAIRAAGKEEEALAMTDEEVAAELAKFKDSDTVPSWNGNGPKYVAYAIKNGITVGDGQGNFKPLDKISGRAFLVFLLKSGMGYKDVTTLTAPDVAVDAGVLTPSQAMAYGAAESGIIRDDAAAILYGAAMNGVCADGKTFIQALIDAGFVDAKVAAENGFITLNTMTAEAAKVDTIKVTFANAVDTADINLTVTKNGKAVDAAAPVWSNGNKVATIKTTAKMTKGTYTVTATFASDEDLKLTADFEVVDQYVDKIVILNDVALTGTNTKGTDDTSDDVEAGLAYIYYDVLDQYGESLRTSTTIEWSFSVERVRDDRTNGMIILKRSDDRAFTYGEKIYVTGVYTKTGVTVTKVVEVGMKQALDTIEVAGFVKKGTTDIVESLPSGFKDKTYYMVYTTLDQNGNPYSIDKPVYNNEVTFVSDNVLLVKELAAGTNGENETKLVINGVEYNAIFVTPGINVGKGGEVNITAIANKTGNKTVKNVAVGEDQILTSFTLLPPKDMVADGEEVEIPFRALDQNGNEIKNFVTLAKHSTFNKLTFTASDGKLILSEEDDGTAKLTFKDDPMLWSDSQSTDGIDRTVSLTSVVVGGDTSGQLIYIQDKARPEAIKDVKMDNVLVEGGSTTLRLNSVDDEDDEDNACSFIFLDQYGREMDEEDSGDFFLATNSKNLHGAEFNGYRFAVRATYKGNADLLTGQFDGGASQDLTPDHQIMIAYNKVYTITAEDDVTQSAKSGMSFKFEIVKAKADDFSDVQAVSAVKNEDMTIVDITAVRNFAIKDLNKFYVNTTASSASTGELAGITDITDPIPDGELGIPSDYVQTVEVTGTYNGQDVNIPASYLEFSAGKLQFEGAKVVSTSPGAIKWSDFYDATTARYLRKDTTDTIKVKVYDGDNAEVIDTVSKSVTLSDAEPKVATITGPDTWTVNPDLTKIRAVDFDAFMDDEIEIKDQYGFKIEVTPTFKISGIVQNAAGYADNNFKVRGNDTENISVEGAERGDTFVLTIKAGDVTKEIKVTVGADKQANITDDTNYYLDVLINGANGLEAQRQAGLQ